MYRRGYLNEIRAENDSSEFYLKVINLNDSTNARCPHLKSADLKRVTK